jgi:hypothetical protein
MWIRLTKESKGDYPVDSGLARNAQRKSYDFTSLRYFGDCRNTVDIDHMWDATQMSGVLLESKIVDFKDVESLLEDGDRKVPSKLKRWLLKNPDKVNDESELVCGFNEYQGIFFIYVSELDIHFFFDAKVA